jgi:hypothetical protein
MVIISPFMLSYVGLDEHKYIHLYRPPGWKETETINAASKGQKKESSIFPVF